jgi:hypothetical protein
MKIAKATAISFISYLLYLQHDEGKVISRQVIFDFLVTQTSNKHLLDKESNWFRYIRIHASVYGLALFERQYIGRLADVYCNRT